MRYFATIITGLLGLGLVTALGCSESVTEHQITIAFSNNMHGEIRSCGCGDHDYGGLGRRATFMDGLRKRSENFFLFEGGDFFGVGVNYGEQKARLTTQSMSFMRYDGIVVGEKDFVQGLDYLIERVESLKLPVVAANLVDTQTSELIFPPSRILESPDGLRVGIIGVLGPGLSFPDAVPPDRLRIGSPKAAIERELRMFEDVDIVVVLAHLPTANAQKLAQEIPGIDVIVAGHDARPTRRPKMFGKTYVLTTADRGRYMGAAWGTYDSKSGSLTLTREITALDEDYKDHEAIVKLFRSYDIEIARIEKAGVSTGVPQGDYAKRAFAGDESCMECHADIHLQWGGTKHAHAFAVLESLDRHFDRDCTPCHTTGFYEMGGFMSMSETPDLANIQCEACHGNSALHSRSPKVKTPGNARAVCVGCHTEEQTESFTFQTYWPRIAH